MRVFIFLLIGVCTLAAHADTQDTDKHDDRSGDSEATEAIVQESQSDPG